MRTLNYKQTLEIVENFMLKTGIRNFCTNVCKGSCCGRCYTSENACHKHEGRRLSCSAYVCQLPSHGKSYEGPDGLNHLLISGRAYLNKAISDTYKKHNDLGMKPYIQYTGEVYFFVPSPLLFTDLKVNADNIKRCFVGLVAPVKKVVEAVVQAWEEVKNSSLEYVEKPISSKFSGFEENNGRIEHYQVRYNRYLMLERKRGLQLLETRKNQHNKKMRRSTDKLNRKDTTQYEKRKGNGNV